MQVFLIIILKCYIEYERRPRNTGCLLDLRARFPLYADGDDAQIGGEEPWREQACLLEEEVRTLKRKAALESAGEL